MWKPQASFCSILRVTHGPTCDTKDSLATAEPEEPSGWQAEEKFLSEAPVRPHCCTKPMSRCTAKPNRADRCSKRPATGRLEREQVARNKSCNLGYPSAKITLRASTQKKGRSSSQGPLPVPRSVTKKAPVLFFLGKHIYLELTGFLRKRIRPTATPRLEAIDLGAHLRLHSGQLLGHGWVSFLFRHGGQRPNVPQKPARCNPMSHKTRELWGGRGWGGGATQLLYCENY